MKAECVIDYRLQEMPCGSGTATGWHRFFEYRLSVSMFPLTRQMHLASHAPGLYTSSWAVLTELVGNGVVRVVMEHIFLYGYKCLLGLLRQEGGWFIWRCIAGNPESTMADLEDNIGIWEYPPCLIHMASPQNGRHFVLGGPDHQRREYKARDQGAAVEHLRKLVPSINQPVEEPLVVLPPALSTATPSSSDQLTDSDMLSVSDSSEKCEPFGDSPFPEVLSRALHQLLGEWRGMRCRPNSSETAAPAQSPAATASAHDSVTLVSSNTHHISHNKRSRGSQNYDNDSDDDEAGFSGPPNRKKKKHEVGPDRRSFACPFWKRRPEAHRECFRYQLSRIRDVKTHLRRQHTPTYYCERCLCILGNARSHRNHVQAEEPCRPRPEAKLNGVTSQQVEELRRKCSRGSTLEDQWYAIWDILFEDRPRPGSPYMDFDLSREFSEWNEFCEYRGPDIIAQQIVAEFRSVDHMPPEAQLQRLREIVRAGFQATFQAFRIRPTPDDLSLAASTGSAAGANTAGGSDRRPIGVLASSSSSRSEHAVSTAQRPSSGLNETSLATAEIGEWSFSAEWTGRDPDRVDSHAVLQGAAISHDAAWGTSPHGLGNAAVPEWFGELLLPGTACDSFSIGIAEG